VICEVEVNRDKDRSTAYEYIKNKAGNNRGQPWSKNNILTIEQYEDLVKKGFSKKQV